MREKRENFHFYSSGHNRYTVVHSMYMISCRIAPQTNCLGDRTVENIVLPPPCLTGSHFEPFWKRPIAFKKIVCLLFTKKCMVLRVFKLSSTREFLIWMRDTSAMVKCQILHPHHMMVVRPLVRCKKEDRCMASWYLRKCVDVSVLPPRSICHPKLKTHWWQNYYTSVKSWNYQYIPYQWM